MHLTTNRQGLWLFLRSASVYVLLFLGAFPLAYAMDAQRVLVDHAFVHRSVVCGVGHDAAHHTLTSSRLAESNPRAPLPVAFISPLHVMVSRSQHSASRRYMPERQASRFRATRQTRVRFSGGVENKVSSAFIVRRWVSVCDTSWISIAGTCCFPGDRTVRHTKERFKPIVCSYWCLPDFNSGSATR